MQIKYSDEMEQVVEYAQEEAMRTGYYCVNTEHLLLGVLRHGNNAACDALVSEGLDLDLLKNRLDAQILRSESIPFDEMEDVFLSRDAQNTLSLAILEASMEGIEEAGSGELLLAITRSEDSPCKQFLAANGINRANLSLKLERKKSENLMSEPSKEDMRNALLFGLDRACNFLDNDIKIYS